MDFLPEFRTFGSANFSFILAIAFKNRNRISIQHDNR
jgi:hypothetical protein